MRSTGAEHWCHFGDFVKAHRLRCGETLRGFARAIPIAPSYACLIESGQVPPPSDAVLVRMAELLDLPAQRLFIQAGHLPPEVLQALWSHPAMPPILSTLPGMTLEQSQTFCQHALAGLPQSTPA
jgi:hypothetical protein